jgi:hypothetical protein
VHKEVLKLLPVEEEATLIVSFMQLPFLERLLLALFQITSFPFLCNVHQLYQ